MELIYYFKNIKSLTLESTNFSLNSDEFDRIREVSALVDNKFLILIWQFTIKTLEEIDIVSNQNLSIEMFLIRLMYLKDINKNDHSLNKETPKEIEKENQQKNEQKIKFHTNESNDLVNQIKSVTQEKNINPIRDTKIKVEKKDSIISFDQLIKICGEKK